MQFNFQLSLISGPRDLPASHREDSSGQTYCCQGWWLSYRVDAQGNWPWMVQPDRCGPCGQVPLLLRTQVYASGFPDVQSQARQSVCGRNFQEGTQLEVGGEGERQGASLGDAHEKAQREVAGEKKGGVGRTPGSPRRICLVRGRRRVRCGAGRAPGLRAACPVSLPHRIISVPYEANHVMLICQLRKPRLGDCITRPGSLASPIPAPAFLSSPLCRFPVQRKHKHKVIGIRSY